MPECQGLIDLGLCIGKFSALQFAYPNNRFEGTQAAGKVALLIKGYESLTKNDEELAGLPVLSGVPLPRVRELNFVGPMEARHRNPLLPREQIGLVFGGARQLGGMEETADIFGTGPFRDQAEAGKYRAGFWFAVNREEISVALPRLPVPGVRLMAKLEEIAFKANSVERLKQINSQKRPLPVEFY